MIKTGIYKITNTINGNSYIGLGVDIYRRWSDHKYRYKSATSKEYDKVLYNAFRKHGIENFTFEIIEECDINQLADRERYWIEYYDTYHNGYNATPGGDYIDNNGEKHPNHKLTEQDVIEIRQRWAECKISTQELYYDYKHRIGKSGFHKIYTWQTWKNILPELYTQERRDWHRNNLRSYSNFGDKSHMSLISDEDFEKLTQQYLNGIELHDLYPIYGQKYSNENSFKTCMRDRFRIRGISRK